MCELFLFNLEIETIQFFSIAVLLIKFYVKLKLSQSKSKSMSKVQVQIQLKFEVWTLNSNGPGLYSN